MKAKALKSTMLAVLVPSVLLTPAVVRAQGGATAAAQAQSQLGTPQQRIDAAMSAAVKAKVPTELLKSKVAEGEAKHVPPERIAAAVEARMKSLTRAVETTTRAGVMAQSAGELSVTADAIDAGVSENALIRLTREAPAERRTVAIATLADLVRLGNASDRALARVSAAVMSSAALANLRAEVTSQLTVGGLSSTLDATGLVRVP
jgi:hypothetical protein